MQITYIHHSCFLIETETVLLLFDYFKGEFPENRTGKPVVVFSSHRHADHFSSKIFSLSAMNYILSSDIDRNDVPIACQEQTWFLSPDTEIYLEKLDMSIAAYASTDEGVAFVVKVDGITIYHAGDLNYWYWKEEGDQWNDWVSQKYHEELKKIALKSPIDLAFVPLDGRLGDGFSLGILDFITIVGAKKIFPMYFWGDFSIIDRFLSQSCPQNYQNRIVKISYQGENFLIPEREDS